MYFSYFYRGFIILYFIICKIMVYKYRVIFFIIRYYFGIEFVYYGFVQEYFFCRIIVFIEYKIYCYYVIQDKLKEEILQNLQIYVCIVRGLMRERIVRKDVFFGFVFNLILFYLQYLMIFLFYLNYFMNL